MRCNHIRYMQSDYHLCLFPCLIIKIIHTTLVSYYASSPRTHMIVYSQDLFLCQFNKILKHDNRLIPMTNGEKAIVFFIPFYGNPFSIGLFYPLLSWLIRIDLTNIMT